MQFEESLENSSTEKPPPLANSMIVFMVRELFTFLQFPYVQFPCRDMQALGSKLDGQSMNTSKQSTITATLFPNEERKHCGLVFHKLSQSGHIIKHLSRTSIIYSKPLGKNARNRSYRKAKSACDILKWEVESQFYECQHKLLEWC